MERGREGERQRQRQTETERERERKEERGRERERERERERRKRGRERERQTDRQTERDRQTDREQAGPWVGGKREGNGREMLPRPFRGSRLRSFEGSKRKQRRGRDGWAWLIPSSWFVQVLHACPDPEMKFLEVYHADAAPSAATGETNAPPPGCPLPPSVCC